MQQTSANRTAYWSWHFKLVYLGIVEHACFQTLEMQRKEYQEFKASLSYRASSRTVRANKILTPETNKLEIELRG